MSLYFDSQKQVFRINIRKGGRRVRKALPKGTTEHTAREIHSRLLNDIHKIHHRSGEIAGWSEAIDAALAQPDSWIAEMHKRAVGRSAVRGQDCRLSLDDLEFICRRSGGRCEVTGLPFSDQRVGPRNFRPYRQSLDRVDSMVGYSLENCRVVCAAVNLAMGTWGADVLHHIATGLVLNRFYPPWLSGEVVEKCTPFPSHAADSGNAS